MTQWYVKELSQLTHISVQTLHHYDRIGLLKPSLRLANGYRVYSEKDLSKLQQIISLKFFGFELSQINELLSTDIDLIDHLSTQSKLLEEKAQSMLEASQTLKKIIANCNHDKPMTWETMVQLIEIYRATQQLEKTWVGKVFNQDELNLYAHFEQDLKTRFTENEIAHFEKERASIIDEIDANLDKDPASNFGFHLAKRGMDWSNKFYGKKYRTLAINIWQKGYKSDYLNQIKTDYINLVDQKLSHENVAWFDKAVEHYYITRIAEALNQIETQPHEKILTLWHALLVEMYGNDAFPREELISLIMNDDRISKSAKNWLGQILTL